MLEGLDKIDWMKVGKHLFIESDNALIPEKIRALLSQDNSVFQEACDYLLGDDQTIGDIADTTSIIISFILKLLATHQLIEPEYALKKLVYKLRRITSYNLTFHNLRKFVQTYDVLVDGIPLFTEMLSSKTKNIRRVCVDLLGYFLDKADLLIPLLIKQYSTEPEPDIQAKIIGSIVRLIKYGRFESVVEGNQLKEQLLNFCFEAIEQTTNNEIQVAAAKGIVDVAAANDIRLVKAGEILLDDMIKHRDSITLPKTRPSTLEYLAQLTPDYLLKVLQSPTLKPHEVHLIVRGLLLIIFRPFYGYREHWQHRFDNTDWKHPPFEKFYRIHNSPPNTLTNQQKLLVNTILENDAFWQFPTNLFSFFYGLPDSRDELRALIEKS